MKKMIGITVCNKCRYYSIMWRGRKAVCMLAKFRPVIAEGIDFARAELPIPEWCPLPDYPGES